VTKDAKDAIVEAGSPLIPFDPSQRSNLVARGLCALEQARAPMWPMAAYDSRRSGCCPHDTSRSKGRVKWMFETPGSIELPPAIATCSASGADASEQGTVV
jgi:hypothetical protein